ncbi:MAG: hypothetical protein LBG96_05505 [Tannerella sp.]|jgi:hypothetical protein|nr:hypothetical protein [Tannerella sp.]
MYTRIKKTILCVLFIGVWSSCTYKEEDSHRITYSGYVAFDYTYNVINDYTRLFKSICRFNEYHLQPTAEKRDSVDRLYFQDTKIINEGNNTWTLRNINSYYSNSTITINTHGNDLYEDGNRWNISIPGGDGNLSKIIDLEIENKGNDLWHIAKHNNSNADFDYSVEWDIHFYASGKGFTLEGNGALISIASPKLKLEYTITNPLEAHTDNYNNPIIQTGSLKILATDVNKKITEDTFADIISDNHIEITYNGHVEIWDYNYYYYSAAY